MNAITNLTPHQLRQAADIQEKLLSLQNELNQLLDLPSNGYTAAPKGGKRNMSAAGRAAISAAAKARWAKFRSGRPAKKASGKKKMTPAGRARLAAFARERWRKVKAMGKSKL